MKMGKKVREYKAGDFIFAKVKGYPAWPARVQRMNGKKYFVYFYGTGETANLPPNMIFDYSENKDKFLTKTVKRRDFNDGVKQIEYDFANNVPLEQVIGVPPETEVEANDAANESAVNETVDESMADTTAADDTIADENTTQNDTGIEDSDETGALVIDEGKQGKVNRKSTAKTPPAKETPKVKEPKTPRGRAKKEEDGKEEFKEDDKKEEEIVSRSGRKIRPKRYIDEHTEENATLPSPAPKKRRGASPVERENKEKEKDKEKNIKHFNAVTQAELEDLKEPFTPEDQEKENIIIAYLPSGQYIGVKLFQSRPNNFKNESTKLQWDKQAATNALTLKMQLEKGHITAQSVIAQLVMDLNLTDEEKATLDKDRETEEKKSRVQFLKTEMKLIELDAKIKTCLCLEKADTELCLKLLDELMEQDIKPLMLLKHPTTLETIKRMRAYVGNTPSWELSEDAALLFSQHAHKIRKQADTVYNNLKELFVTPEGLSFWEFFMERVAQFKKATSKLTSDELLEMIHEPLEMSVPTSHTMKTAVEAANELEKEEEEAKNNKTTTVKTKKTANSTPSKAPIKRQSSRKQQEDKEKEQTRTEDSTESNKEQTVEETSEKESTEEDTVDKDENKDKTKGGKPSKEDDKVKEGKETREKDTKDKEKDTKEIEKDTNDKEKDTKDKEKQTNDKNDDIDAKESQTKEKTPEKTDEDTDVESKKQSSSEEEKREGSKETEKEKSTEKGDKGDKKEEKLEDEPRAKRSRESKKTDPPPRSPTKRKSKF